MRITNRSQKIINIGTVILLPDASIDVKANIANLPSVKVLEEMELLSIDRTSDGKPQTTNYRPTAEETAATESVKDTLNEIDEASTPTDDDLEKLNKAELLEKCKELGIEVKSNESKTTLVAKIREAMN